MAAYVNGELVTIIEVTASMRIRRAGLDHAVPVAAQHGGQAAVSELISTRAVT